MRHSRWLILAAICIIVLTVGATYVARVERGRRDAPPPPPVLKEGVEGTAEGWHYAHSEGGCPVFEAKAKKFEQVAEPTATKLQGVAIRLFHDCGKKSDQVSSAKASFDAGSGVMTSEGEVEITMGVPTEGEEAPEGRLLKIVSSGVQFDTKTGKARTDAQAKFHFDRGEGQAVGAEYDPNTRELRLKSQVDLTWRGTDKKAPPMHVEAGEATYWERNGEVALAPWSKLTRETSHIESTGTAHVMLQNGAIRIVNAPKAVGTRDEPGRKIEYSADELIMNMDENGEPTMVQAANSAKVASVTKDARMDVTADNAVLGFVPKPGGNELESVVAVGHAVAESKPILKPGGQPPDSRVLRSERIVVKMREGGKEVKDIGTEAPGVIEFLPNRPDQPHRVVDGDRILIAYGPNNGIESFRASAAKTRTDYPPRKDKPKEQRPPALTASKELIASFDPKTQQMKTLEQNGDFTYEEGQRKARADHASLDQTTNLMVLTGSARAADPTGSTAADRITMNQKTGDVTAEGRVNSTRLPDKKKDANPALLSGDQPMQARANKMFSSEDNAKIRYEGNAVAWQGANKVEADTIVFDRDEGEMKAAGNVVSQFVDKAKQPKDGKAAPKQNAAPVFTIVKAPAMVYTDDDRLADYTGGAVMTRPNLTVKAKEIKAWLKDSDSDSSLDKAFADGAVVIDQNMAGRKRVGTSEHAEYYAGEEKIIMTGGAPKMVDSLKGETTGEKLTYFTTNDTLLVNGVEAKRAESLIKRKKK